MDVFSLLSFVVVICLPWSLGADQKDDTLRRYKINGGEWKEAQNVINKLVDESIANKVTEAEKDMAELLEQNIVEHIKHKGPYLSAVKKDCKDTMVHCDVLDASGVCKSSPKAMREHCPKTCNLCPEYVQISPEVQIVMKPKGKVNYKKDKSDSEKEQSNVTVSANAVARHNLYSVDQSAISEETVADLHSIEPLLSKQSKVAMKYHNNDDMSDENEKIRDAQKLLEYVKVLKNKPPTKKKSEDVSPNAKSNVAKLKRHSIKKVNISKKKALRKVKGVPMEKLSKTITYKNQKYKVTPIVDWKKISKMLKSLGYKAIHIVGMKHKHLSKGLKKHLKDNGVTKVTTGKGSAHAAADTVEPASHRQKNWRNADWFKENCHPMCLVSCVGSCRTGCCKEHDKLQHDALKTGRPSYCHPDCLANCVPSCGGGCCSAEDEKKRRHNVLHYKGISAISKDAQEDKKKAKQQAAKQKAADLPAKQKKQPKKAVSHSDAVGKKGSSRGVNMDLSSSEMYEPKARMCPEPCPVVCAPSCADSCCGFGAYAPDPANHVHPGLQPNVPYPNQAAIPASAFICKESCKFQCNLDCPQDCCQPEGLAQRDQRLQIGSVPLLPPPQPAMAYLPAAPIQTFQAAAGTCPSPCPGNCAPSCTVACCASALGLPQADEEDPDARSSTWKVLHVTHVLRPVDTEAKRKALVARSCAATCSTHCTPACARSGCCDSIRK